MVIATSLKTTNCAQNLGEATQNILENAFYIAKQKLELSRKAYKQLIKQWCWDDLESDVNGNQINSSFSGECILAPFELTK